MAGQEHVRPRREDAEPDDGPDTPAPVAPGRAGARRRGRRAARRDRRRPGVQRRAVRARLRPEGRSVTADELTRHVRFRAAAARVHDARARRRSWSSCPATPRSCCRVTGPAGGRARAARHHDPRARVRGRDRHGGGPPRDHGLDDREPGDREGLPGRRVLGGRHRRHRGPRRRAGPAVPARARALREDRGQPALARRQGQPARDDDPRQPRHGDAGAGRGAAVRRLRPGPRASAGSSPTTSRAAATRSTTTTRSARARCSRAARSRSCGGRASTPTPRCGWPSRRSSTPRTTTPRPADPTTPGGSGRSSRP